MKVYEIVTKKIIEELEKGHIPWRKPWDDVNGMVFHRNAINGKPYKGINPLLLSMARESEEYPYNLWLTYKQAKNLKGFIAKGAKAHMVVFWKLYFKKDNEVIDNIEDVDVENEDDIEKIYILRYYKVFNIRDLKPRKLKEKIIKKWESKARANNTFNPIERAERLIEKYKDKPPIIWNHEKACYNHKSDKVYMPPKSAFKTVEDLYAILFHELIHSTGHKSRLNRLNGNFNFGSHDYSKEELIAEIGSSYLANIAKINTQKVFKNSIAYIQSWIKRFKEHPKMIILAASAAQKAVDYILRERR